MLAHRITPVFLLRDGRVVKSKRFTDYRDVGDPISQARIAYANGADEIVALNTQPEKGIQPLIDVLHGISEQCFIPVSVGGGIRSIDDVKRLFAMGVEKVVIRTAIDLIPEIASRFGCQAAVQCIDYDGHLPMISPHAGEVIFQSVQHDGMMQGYDLKTFGGLKALFYQMPIVLLGGCGNYQHMLDAFNAGADACAASSLFCFTDSNPLRAKRWLRNHGTHVRSS